MSQIRELMERINVAMETKRVIEARRSAAEGLRYIAEDAQTLPAARSTAESAILGMAQALDGGDSPGHDIDPDVVVSLPALRELMDAGNELGEAALQHWDDEHLGPALNRWADALAAAGRAI